MINHDASEPTEVAQSKKKIFPFRRRNILLLLIAVFAMTPFFVRQWHLSKVTDIAEPFDVAAFSHPKVVAGQNAFEHYRDACRIHVSKSNDGESEFPSGNYFLVRVSGWDMANSKLKKWIADRQDVLESWKKGTDCEDSLYLSPAEVDGTTQMPVLESLLEIVKMARCEAARLEAEEDFAEAAKWCIAIQRCSRHLYYHGGIDQRQMGWTFHINFYDAISRWMHNPKVTSEQLLATLKEVQKVDKMTVPLSTMLKTEYILATNTFKRYDWVRAYGLADSETTGDSATTGMSLFYWTLAEPQTAQRVLKHILTNQLNEIDKPFAVRQPFVYSSVTMLYQSPAGTASKTLSVDSDQIHKYVQQSLIARHALTPRINFLELSFQLERTRQKLLEIAFAAEACRRDIGQFPSDTSMFVPKYLDEWPIDPWDRAGLPIRYSQQTPTTILFWSVGLNGADDNGDVEGRRISRFSPDPSDFGMVLRSE